MVGAPDPILGMAIKAVVALAPGADLTEQNIIRHCAKHLEDFMVPKIVEFRDELPKTEFRQDQPPPRRRDPSREAQ